MRRLRCIAILIMFILLFASSANAKDAAQASVSIETVRHIIKECESIIVCKYDCAETKSYEWDKPPIVRFWIEDYLKGPPLGDRLMIRYDFHDTTKNEAPKNWRFAKSLMPAKNSKWILAIPNAVPTNGAMDSFHGSTGRIEATEENLDLFRQVVHEELERANLELKEEKRNLIQNLKEMVANSEGVYVCEFRNFKERELGATWYHPPTASYRICEYLMGPPFSAYLPIKFEFGERGQPKPAGWQFDKSMMPAKGSKWILVIPNGVPIDGMFETYHGSAGRMEATQKNLDLLNEAVKLIKEEHDLR